MVRPRFPLAMGLAVLAICLLALSPDARAQPRDRRTGERKTLSTNDPQVQRMAQTAVTTFNKGSNSVYFYRDTNIIKAERQVRRAGELGQGAGWGARAQRGCAQSQEKGAPKEHPIFSYSAL